MFALPLIDDTCHRCRDGYTPTPEEIEAAKAEIRAENMERLRHGELRPDDI